MKKILNLRYKAFAFLLLLVGVSAVIGGYGLITTNGLGMPTSWLEGSPFKSYLFPGLILTFIIGGIFITTSVLIFMKYKYAMQASVIAGICLVIWIFTEVYIIKHSNILQWFYFLIAIFTIIAGLSSMHVIITQHEKKTTDRHWYE